MVQPRALITINSTYPIHVGGKVYGGIEVYVSGLAEYLSTLNWEVDIVCSCDSTSTIRGVNIVKLGTKSTKLLESEGIIVTKFNWKDYYDTLNSLKLDEYNLIVINTHNKGILDILYSNSSERCKIIQYIHNLPRWKDTREYASILNNYDRLHKYGVSDLTCSQWNRLGAGLKYLPIGLLDKSKLESNEEFNSTINLNLLAMVSRVIPAKNPDKLIKIVEKFKGSVTGVLSGVIENNKYSKSLAEKFNKCEFCSILPEISGDNYLWIDYIRVNNPILVTLSSIESLGFTPIEAFMCGLPCLAIYSDQSAVSETILRGTKDNEYFELGDFKVNGFIINGLGGIASDENNFVKMLKYIQDNWKFNRSYLRNHYLENYSMDNHLNLILNKEA